MSGFGSTLSETIRHLGFFAPCGLILLLVIQQICPLVPSSFLIGLGGALFGPFWGILYSWIGVVASGAVCYGLGMNGNRLCERLEKRRFIRWMKALLAKRSLSSILILRAVPLFPFNAVSLGAGALRVRFIPYLLATAIGILPNLALYALLGDGGGRLAIHLLKTYFLRM